MTAGAVGRPFAHVTADDRDQVGIRRDPRGDAGETCKIAGLRLPRFESWSCHTPSDLRKRGFCAPAHAARPGRVSLRFRSAGRGADADRTAPAPQAEHARRSGWAVCEQDGVRPPGQPWRGRRSRGHAKASSRGGGGTGRATLAHRAESTAGWSALVRSPRAGGVPVVSLVCFWPGGNTPETNWATAQALGGWSLPRRGRLTETPASVPLQWPDLLPAHRRASPRPSRPAGRRRSRRGTRPRGTVARSGATWRQRPARS